MARPNTKNDKRSTRRSASDKAPIVDLRKGDDDGDDDEDDDEEDDDGDDYGKSEVDVSDLRKAMDDLEGRSAALASGQSPRAVALAAKMAAGEKLSKSENEEYIKLLQGDDSKSTPAAEEIRKSEGVQEAVDASDFLLALVNKTGGKLDSLRDEIRKSAADSNEFFAQLGAGFVQLGRTVGNLAEENALLKSELAEIKEQLGIVSEQPRQPKGSTKPASRPNMRKSEGGDDGDDGVQLSKSQIQDTLDEMLHKGEFPQGSEPLTEISMYESTEILKPATMAIVAKKRGIKLDIPNERDAAA